MPGRWRAAHPRRRRHLQVRCRCCAAARAQAHDHGRNHAVRAPLPLCAPACTHDMRAVAATALEAPCERRWSPAHAGTPACARVLARRRVALERELIKCQGKTPEATMASALYTDVKRKGDKSVFTRCAARAARRRSTAQVQRSVRTACHSAAQQGAPCARHGPARLVCRAPPRPRLLLRWLRVLRAHCPTMLVLVPTVCRHFAFVMHLCRHLMLTLLLPQAYGGAVWAAAVAGGRLLPGELELQWLQGPGGPGALQEARGPAVRLQGNA